MSQNGFANSATSFFDGGSQRSPDPAASSSVDVKASSADSELQTESRRKWAERISTLGPLGRFERGRRIRPRSACQSQTADRRRQGP